MMRPRNHFVVCGTIGFVTVPVGDEGEETLKVKVRRTVLNYALQFVISVLCVLTACLQVHYDTDSEEQSYKYFAVSIGELDCESETL